MKTLYSYPCIGMAAAVLVAVSVLFAGCSSQPATQPATPAAPQVSVGVTTVGTTTASLPYGVSLSVPSTWTREDVLKSGVRDYGKDTVNIANFYSPTTTPGDPSSYNTLSIDFDPHPGSDFEDYFNKATLAVEKTYHTEKMVNLHSSTMDISGHKSYELAFDSFGVKGYYIFTLTDNGMYIFAFKGSDKQAAVMKLQEDVADISKSITITPTAADITPHR